MNRIARRLAVATAASLASLVAMPSAWAVDARTETAAKAAMKKAADKYLATDYAAAMVLLSKAVRACGAKKCSPGTKAAVLRDLGTMQFRSGDKTAASKSFTDALAIQPALTLNPDYDAPDLRAAWNDAKGTGGAPESHPDEDFVHTPATEQTTNTPLPIYVESPGSKFLRVVVKYKGAQMKEWESLELKRVGKGWGGVIPCNKVTVGNMRYWIEGFDQGGDASGTAGDPERPFTVSIRDEISSEAPHLPNRPAPQQCEENEAAPEHAGAEEKEEKSAHVASLEGSGGEYARWWIGVAGAVDFISLSGGTDLCGLTALAAPANAAGYYCTNPDGSDFPNRLSSAQARSLVPGQAGNVAGGFVAGDLRVMLAIDYALSPEMLIGARLGYLYNSYPGTAAVTDHRAFGSKVHVEARGTYVFGHEPLLHTGFAPAVFVALGVSEFDGHTTALVTTRNGGAATATTVQPVEVWLTNGPWFVAVGGGARYQFSPRAAFNGALRVNGAFGGQGALFTFGPEISFQYGF